MLQRPPLVQAALNLRHKLFRHVDGNTTPIRPTVQNTTLMLFARLARRAILAAAPATPQAQRTEKRRPKICRFTQQPVRDIRRRFRINILHRKNVDTMHMYATRKIARKTSEKTPNLKGEMRFATETSLVFVRLAHDRRFVGVVLFFLIVLFVFIRISGGIVLPMITKGLQSINL